MPESAPSKKQLPEIQIPPPPPLRTHYGEFQVFGWDFHAKDIVEWADEHGIAPNETKIVKQTLGLREISKRFPEKRRVTTGIHYTNSSGRSEIKLCFVVGTNRTQKELDRAMDIEIVRKHQEALGWTKPPQWHEYASDQD